MQSQLSYDDLLTWLFRYNLSLEMLLFSNSFYVTHLLTKFENCSQQTEFVGFANLHDFTPLVLNSAAIEIEIQSNLPLLEVSVYEEGLQKMLRQNNHFLRTKAINASFEIIQKYFRKAQDKQNWERLHSLDWFQVLYTLRNVASHADSFNAPVLDTSRRLIRQFPNLIQWETIQISKQNIGNVRYNDREALALLKHTLIFFRKNRSDWEISISQFSA